MNVLVLGGTSEARKLAGVLTEREGIETTLSLAGVTSNPLTMPVPVRMGGFGGVAGLQAHIRERAIDLIVDASHPFAGQMSRHAVAACQATSCTLWRLERPAWTRREGDDWHAATDLDNAAAQLSRFGPNVFLSVGARSLQPFEHVTGKRWIVRSIDPPEHPPAFADWTFVQGKPPFTYDDEIDLLGNHGVDVVVTKNSGATATRAKLDAACELGVPVLMVQRPGLPEPDRHFTDIEDAVAALAPA